MNKELRIAVRYAVCQACRLSTQADGDDVCVTGDGPNGARIVVVTKFPAGGRTRREMTEYLEEAGIDHTAVMWCSALKCRVWDMNPTKTDQKACAPYLAQELAHIKPDYVLAIGNEALFATTGHAGIMKYRGKVFDHATGAQVFPTISPAMVARNPGYRAGFMADLAYFNRLTIGEDNAIPHHTPGSARTQVRTKDALRAMLAAVHDADAYSYDIETTGASEHDSGARIVSIAITTAGPDGMDSAHVWELPLFHPESPWRTQWERILEILGRVMMRARRRIAHNAKFDTRWLHEFGIPNLVPSFDTIVAAALLDENRPKGLKPLAQQILGADPWGIDTRDLLTTPLDEVLEYNGLDTWHTLRLYYVFREQLRKRPRLGRLFIHLMMPLVQELVDIEREGVYVDRVVLDNNHAIAISTLADIEHALGQFVPETLPDQFYNRRHEPQVNFGPSNFARWFLFDHLGLPITKRGKTKDDGTPGAPSMAEAVMMDLADRVNQLDLGPDKPNVPALMLDRALWYKRITGFFGPYTELLDDRSRIHTTFKPWGTVTGRLSSGKEDAEKITARGDIRGVNLQQVPRDVFLRGVFGAPPGSSFVEADYSQIELRIAAWLANETTMLHLYATGQDIHLAMAMRMTGKPAHAITKEERKRAKAVNFGFLYGMGWFKFIETAWANYGIRVSEGESRAFRVSFFDQFQRLIPWHNKQRRLAMKYKRVETPMGRVRHLPDVDSPDKEVQSEALRQAINSPVQAMASDMAALSMVRIAREFRRNRLTGHPVGLVHDAVNFEIPDNELAVALPIIKDTMEALPLERLFGVVLNVPIVADLKVGTHWGGARELTTDEIYNWGAAA